MEDRDSTRPDFWTTRYVAGKTPWDFGGVPAALKSFLARWSVPSTVLIPGCGSGYEVEAFVAARHDVTAIDFSPAAVGQAKRVLGSLADRVILADFFTHDFGQRRFDVIYERTLLCSMAPPHWLDYAKRIAELLSPGGSLIGFFFYGEGVPSAPPFPLTNAKAEELFKTQFQLVRDEAVSDSLPLFLNRERWQEWRKIVSK
jgi:SAM-dependent methyltransferase